ncbi:MAG: hypothetical protein KDK39_17015 [Leptospiraceae bacterium]|nr:hypothetical protein [Leptospiraceae bacterium]
MKKPGFLLGILALWLLWACQSAQPKSIDDFIVVSAVGDTRQEAVNSAYRKILEQGLGVLVSGSSLSVDAEARDNMISTATEGFVHSFEVIEVQGQPPADEYWEILARGKVSEKAVQDSLAEYSRQFRPRLMAIFNEQIGGQQSKVGNTYAELKFISIFKEFPFVDQEQFKRVMARESGQVVNAYGSPSALNRALQVAAEMNAEILVIGTVESKQSQTGLRGSTLKPVHSTVRLKLINVGTAQIWAARSEEAAIPSLQIEQGAVQSIEKALKTMQPYLLSQIETRVRAGNTIRVTINNISYDDYTDRDIVRILSQIAGVNTVRDRGNASGGKGVVLEVEARMTGPALYKQMRLIRDRLQLDFESQAVQSNSIIIRVTGLK